MRIIAHRGVSSLAPENTMAAFVKCLDLGVTWFEFDVHMSADASLIVMHDDTVDRTTDGTGQLADMTFDQLRRLDAGAWFSPAYRLERIPELASVIDLINTTALSANLEAKAFFPSEAHREEYLDVLVRAVEKVKDPSKLLISSFNPVMLEHFRDYSTALLADKGGMRSRFDEYLAKASDLGCVAINPEDKGLTEAQVDAIHGQGMAVNVWTVNSVERAAELDAMGVDSIFTDVPQEMGQFAGV